MVGFDHAGYYVGNLYLAQNNIDIDHLRIFYIRQPEFSRPALVDNVSQPTSLETIFRRTSAGVFFS